MSIELGEIVAQAVDLDASDIYLTVGQPVFFRIHGKMEPWAGGKCSEEDMSTCIEEMLGREQQERLREDREMDFSWESHGRRFRGNAYFQRGWMAVVLRLLSDRIFSFGEIGVEKALNRLLAVRDGLILVTGTVGTGKSTTIASYIEAVNQSWPAHVITLEDPLEYVYKPKKCFISQRELGRDFLSFPRGLRSALREMPDIILVGELRDAETMRTALMAAETGILVLGTLHTKSAAETAMRVEGMFPANQREVIREQFAAVFTGILSQQLVPSEKGGRVCAAEVLLATTAARSIIRQGKYPQLNSVMMSGRELGMQTRQTALKELHRRGLITGETMERFAL